MPQLHCSPCKRSQLREWVDLKSEKFLIWNIRSQPFLKLAPFYKNKVTLAPTCLKKAWKTEKQSDFAVSSFFKLPLTLDTDNTTENTQSCYLTFIHFCSLETNSDFCCCFSELTHSFLRTQLLRATRKLFEGFRTCFSNEVERKIQIRTYLLLERVLR